MVRQVCPVSYGKPHVANMHMQSERRIPASELPRLDARHHKNKIGKCFLYVSYALNVIIIALMVVMASAYWIVFPKICSGYIADLGKIFSLEMPMNLKMFPSFTNKSIQLYEEKGVSDRRGFLLRFRDKRNDFLLMQVRCANGEDRILLNCGRVGISWECSNDSKEPSINLMLRTNGEHRHQYKWMQDNSFKKIEGSGDKCIR